MNNAVLFDLDGTLLDTAPDFIIAVNQLRRDHGLENLSDETITVQVSNGSAVLTQLALNITPEDPSFATARQQLLDYYLACIGTRSGLFTGYKALLSALKNAGIAWGIVTNKPLLYSQALLEKLQLANDCNVLICPDHVDKPKPDPAGLLLAAETLHCATDNIIYVGDHQRDIEAGNRAGMKTIAVAFGYIEPSDNINTWQADFIAEQTKDIKPIVESVFSCKI
ncbi:MAG: phosphoglycolate phosphatase [Cellvibrionales bacterium]|nr:phosphoglycolate phosphatase [Cellvibrionales bacterium]